MVQHGANVKYEQKEVEKIRFATHLLSTCFPMTVLLKASLLSICEKRRSLWEPVFKLSTLFIRSFSLPPVFPWAVIPLRSGVFLSSAKKTHESKICLNAFLVHGFLNRPISINLPRFHSVHWLIFFHLHSGIRCQANDENGQKRSGTLRVVAQEWIKISCENLGMKLTLPFLFCLWFGIAHPVREGWQADSYHTKLKPIEANPKHFNVRFLGGNFRLNVSFGFPL